MNTPASPLDPEPDAIVYPPEFAQRVVSAWAALEIPRVEIPSVACIARTLDVLYQASFLQEEGEAVRCRLILADPTDWKQGEGPPTGFHVLRFAESRAFTPQEIRKLAPAASFYRSILGVHYDAEKGVSIWGIVETGTRWVNRVDGGRFDGAPLPPHFVVHILGPGRLLTACGYQRLLELDSGRIIRTGFDPFKAGWLPQHFRPVRQWLQDRLAETRLEGANVEDCFIRMMAQSVVRRTLSLVRGRGHGGMLIYLPQEKPNLAELSKVLRVRCPFESRLATAHFSELMLRAMSRLSLVGHRHGLTSVTWENYQTIDDPILSEIDESFVEFAHLLADMMSVDGALVLTKRFELVGFGGEVLGEKPVTQVFRALDLEGVSSIPEMADSSGTRHRSAYRFASEVPESLLIVISQDGAVRFVAARNGQIMYWPYLP